MSGSRGSADAHPPFDDQQARLLSILSSRAGEPVRYDELRDAGIEFPAGLVAELELAGVEIDRCRVAVPGGRPVRAVRLPSALEGYSELGEEILEPAPGPGPASIPARALEPTARGPEPTSSLAPGPEPAFTTSPRSEPTSRELPQRELPPTGSAASGPGWGPVRVYRHSAWSTFAARWTRRTRGRDGGPMASELS
jgi:hypothetical protein